MADVGDFTFKLEIQTLSVGSMESASSLNIGRNCLREFRVMTKSNAGIGKIYGDKNSFQESRNSVEDPDGIDMYWDPQGEKAFQDPRDLFGTLKHGRPAGHEHRDQD